MSDPFVAKAALELLAIAAIAAADVIVVPRLERRLRHSRRRRAA